METLAGGNAAPANADNTAQGAATEVDSKVGGPNGDGPAPSVPEADTSAPQVKEDPVQKRINELTREKYDNARLADQRGYELERERTERQRLESEIAELRKSATSQVATDTFPTLEQYGYDEGKFQAAVATHIAKITREQGAAAAQEVIKAERAAEAARRAGETWATKEAEFIKSKPDYVEKVQQARTLPITQEMQQILQGHDLGPQIAYHLVENREAALAIARLPLATQLMEVGRIAERLAAAKAAPKPPVSQAPSPVPKVEGGEAPGHVRVDSADSDALSDAEWTRRRNAQELARRRKANS